MIKNSLLWRHGAPIKSRISGLCANDKKRRDGLSQLYHNSTKKKMIILIKKTWCPNQERDKWTARGQRAFLGLGSFLSVFVFSLVYIHSYVYLFLYFSWLTLILLCICFCLFLAYAHSHVYLYLYLYLSLAYANSYVYLYFPCLTFILLCICFCLFLAYVHSYVYLYPSVCFYRHQVI